MRLMTLASLLFTVACHADEAGNAGAGSAHQKEPATSSSEIVVPPFQASFVPPARGEGNFELCLAQDAAENDVKTVTVPAGIILQSWGHLTGSLRDAQSYDINTVAGNNRAGNEYAVVMEQPVTLSSGQPCRKTTVRAVVHDGFNFNHELIPLELHLAFQAESLSEGADGDISNDAPTTGELGMALSNGFINGTPLRDVANVRRLYASS